MTRYELSCIYTDYESDYNWDRPCAFMGDGRFVAAADERNMFAEDEGRADKQLLFYRLDRQAVENRNGVRFLRKEREAPCTAFAPDGEGKVHGELCWDDDGGFLVAVTDHGAFAIDQNGEILASLPECGYAKSSIEEDPHCEHIPEAGWHYSGEHHVLYHWSPESGEVEERRFDTACIEQ